MSPIRFHGGGVCGVGVPWILAAMMGALVVGCSAESFTGIKPGAPGGSGGAIGLIDAAGPGSGGAVLGSGTGGAALDDSGAGGVVTGGVGSGGVGSGGAGTGGQIVRADAGNVSGGRDAGSGGASVDVHPGDGAPGDTSAAGGTAGPIVYQQTFNALTPGLWNANLDSGKIKAHPENAQVTAGCGPDGSNCFRVVYRHADGIHKQPSSAPALISSGGNVIWAGSDADHTNTATEVIQANINIVGNISGTSDASATAKPNKAYTLTYDLFFEPGFDFGKGGKLPGLAAAGFDSGCTDDGATSRQPLNWSERLMWRANGRLTLFSSDQTRPSGSCAVEMTLDQTAGDPPSELPGTIPAGDAFRFKTGVWYRVRLSVRMNDNNSVKYVVDAQGNPLLDAGGSPQVSSGNGEVSLAVKTSDGAIRRLLVLPNVALRDECDGKCPTAVPDSKDAWVNAIFFSTFFGGNETKRLTCIDATQSTLTNVVPAKLPKDPAGLTQDAFDKLCAGQTTATSYPKLTWAPQAPSAARFDNLTVAAGYTAAPF
ncbi:MAG TPA: hypothetical protein VNO55_01770 [Polyangia bacterium]|nr:hypothetical protein [Polyangia bacterium]